MAAAVYVFGEFSLHLGKFELTRKGHRLRLERKPFELLALLVSRHGQIVTRDEIARHLWEQEVFVDVEHGINTAIRKIRQTLGDSPDLPVFVQTVSGSGYRFIATVATIEPEASEPIQFPAVPAEQPDVPAEPAAPPASDATHETLVAPDFASAVIRRRRFWLIAASCASAIVIAVVAFGFYTKADIHPHKNSQGAIGSIAVLPLQNLSGDPSQQYFADGMTDELITELARIPQLRVVSRTSVMASRDAASSLPDIARRLDVDAIVEGSIVRSGDRIRVTAQLIDGRSDRHLWAQSFEGSAADVLSIQDSVAQQIAAQASFVLSPPAPHPPVNPAALDAYLRGRYFFHKQDFSHCMESFKQAIALDPEYASAYAGYASALDGATAYNLGTPEQLMPQALAAARRAIQLDPRNGEAFTELGSVQTIYGWDWTAAERNLTRGISLNPSDSIAEFKYATYLEAIDRPQDAVTHMRRAVQLDPLSFIMNRRLGVALYYNREYDLAIVQLKRSAEMEQGAGSVEHYLGLTYEQKGELDEAVKHHLARMRSDEPQIDSAALLHIYQQQGWQSYWRATAQALTTSASPCAVYDIGVSDLRAKEIDHAFASFQHAIDHHCFDVTFIRVDPLFNPVRHDPRYAALLARINQ